MSERSYSTTARDVEKSPVREPVVEEELITEPTGANGQSLSRTRSNASTLLARVASRLTSQTITNPGPPPDGGVRAWTQCFCAWIVILNTWGFVNSFGAFQAYYEQILPQSASTISWIGSTQACLMFFVGAFSGRALDAGLLIPTVSIGIILQLIAVFTMSLATKYWQLLLTQGILTGIGGGIFFCPSLGLVSTYFAKRRGMALGMATSGNALGGLIYPLIVRELLPRVGFAWTVRALAFLNLGTLGSVIFLMKPRLPPRKAGPIIEVSAIKDIPYVLFVVGACFLMSSVYYTFYYIASFARDIIGLSYINSVNLVIVINGVGLPARILPGYLADKYLGSLNTVLILTFVNIILLYSWIGIHDIASFYVFTTLYGMFAAGWQSLFPSTIASLGDDISKTGTRLGMGFSTVSFSALVSGPIGGALLQADHGSYVGGQLWSATSAAIGVALLVCCRTWKYGWVLKRKC